MFLLLYFAIALCTLETDALVCYSVKRKFKWKSSIIASLFWPIVTPLTIISVVKAQHKDAIIQTQQGDGA